MPARRAMIDLGPSLTPREAVSDALLRFVQALDESSEELLRSAFTSDGVLDLSGLATATGQEHLPQESIDNILKGVFAHVAPMDSSHHLSNFRVKLNKDQNQAEVTCYALAQHFRNGEGRDPSKKDYLLFGSTYWADVIKDETGEDALWKITRLEPSNLWSEGDRSVTGG